MKKVMLLLFALAVIASCEKDETPVTPTNQESISDYFPLAVGNYWVYQHYNLSVDGVRTNRNSLIDSTVITKDTVINDEKYFVVKKTMRDIIDRYEKDRFYEYYLRDSLGSIIYSYGQKVDLYSNFTDTLFNRVFYNNQDTLVNSSWKMEKPIEKITVPVGTFDVVDFRGTHFSYSSHGIDGPRYSHIYYAKNIGIIKEVIVYAYYLSPSLEKELIRYHINQ